jgi:hypothetical protein
MRPMKACHSPPPPIHREGIHRHVHIHTAYLYIHTPM